MILGRRTMFGFRGGGYGAGAAGCAGRSHPRRRGAEDGYEAGDARRRRGLVGITLSLGVLIATGVAAAASWSNTSAITINDSDAEPQVGTATPYPSTITVSGETGVVQEVTVTLNRFRHDFPDDVDILLVGPQGQSVILLSDAGGIYGVRELDITFEDDAGGAVRQHALGVRQHEPQRRLEPLRRRRL